MRTVPAPTHESSHSAYLKLADRAAYACRVLELPGGEDRTIRRIVAMIAWTVQQTGGASRLAYPSQVRLAGDLGTNERTVRRHVDALEAAGLLTVYRDTPHQRGGRGGTWTRQTNRYHVTWRQIAAALIAHARSRTAKPQVAPRGHGCPVISSGGNPGAAPPEVVDAVASPRPPGNDQWAPPGAATTSDPVPPPWVTLGISVEAWLATV